MRLPNAITCIRCAIPQASFFLILTLAFVLCFCGCGTSGAPSSALSASTTGGHQVVLAWQASASKVVGYNVYRKTVSDSSYVLLNAQPITSLTYTDSTVQSGQTYYYAVTALDGNGVQSAFSNQGTAVIPVP